MKRAPVLLALVFVAVPAFALEDSVKAALDEGCAKVAKTEAKSPCVGVANLVTFKLAKVGVPITKESHAYCVSVCEKTRNPTEPKPYQRSVLGW